MNSTVLRGFDIMLHIADEQCLVRIKPVLLKNLMNLLPLVPDVEVRLIQVFVEAGDAALHRKMIAVHCTQEKGAQAFSSAEFEKLARMRQLAHGILNLLETAVKPGFKLRQRHFWDKPFVKAGEGQAKLGSECFERNLLLLRLRQNVIGRLPDGRQVVHERAGPVEDDIANHAFILRANVENGKRKAWFGNRDEGPAPSRAQP